MGESLAPGRLTRVQVTLVLQNRHWPRRKREKQAQAGSQALLSRPQPALSSWDGEVAEACSCSCGAGTASGLAWDLSALWSR